MDIPLIVLCIDRDNDLYEKAKVHGPVVGREENLKAATKLALADPEDTDANAIFAAIKIFDEIKSEGREALIVTVTGSRKLGHTADLEISKQLDKVVDETHAKSCVFVSDGASDEEVIPIVNSRLKIDSTKVVLMKQAKELEQTYFVILEKLRDPYYARIIIGIPAAIILMFSLASIFGIGWQPIGALIGLFLIMKGFGIDDLIGSTIAEFRFSIDKSSWVAYTSAFVLFAVSLGVMYQAYVNAGSAQLYGQKIYALVMRSGLFVIPWAILFILIGKALDARMEKRKFVITRYALYASAVMLSTMMLKIGADWILNIEPPYVNFGDFLGTILISMIAGYAVNQVIRIIREDMLREMKLDGKEAISTTGAYLGKVVGTNVKEGHIILQTPFERRMSVQLDDISGVADKVVIKE
jgi:putative membrane protein